MIIGCYTAEMGGSGTGLVVPGGPSIATPSPSYVISQGDFLYAVNETAGQTPHPTGRVFPTGSPACLLPT
jgi:hypothetical protein